MKVKGREPTLGRGQQPNFVELTGQQVEPEGQWESGQETVTLATERLISENFLVGASIRHLPLMGSHIKLLGQQCFMSEQHLAYTRKAQVKGDLKNNK